MQIYGGEKEICVLKNIRDSWSNSEVQIIKDEEDKICVRIFNEGGFNATQINLKQFIIAIKKDLPGLWKELIKCS